MSGGDSSGHHHEVTWLRNINFWSKTALKSGIRRFRIEMTRNKSRDFHTRYDPTASSSHVTWENSISVKKLMREVYIQLLHDSCFYSDVKMSFEIKKMTSNDLLGSFLTSRGSSNLFQIIKNKKHGRMMPIFAFLQIFLDIREMTLNDLRGRKQIFWPRIQRGQ